MKKDKQEHFSVTLKYYGVILLSTLGILGTFAGVMGFLGLIPSFGTSTTWGDGTQSQLISKNAYLVIAVVSFVIAIASKPFRQALRDEFEYDENGVNRKKNTLSKLSKKERDEIERQNMIDAERILSSSALRKNTHKGSLNPEEDMKKLTGLASTKEEMHEMFSRMLYEKEKQKDKKKKKENSFFTSSNHMIFMGNPGTGKTTVARIITGFLYKTGYIKKNQIIEIDGNFLTGLAPGESTKRTNAIITKALGGVLFIDEAYALLNDSCSQEIIATLVKEMEDRRGKFILIMAGYSNEMKRLINSNPGIESRVKRYFYFEDFSLDELQQIFLSMAGEEGFCISAEMMNLFTERMICEKKKKNFGNARSVRNLLDKMIDRHAVNMADGVNTKEEKYILTKNDMPVMK